MATFTTWAAVRSDIKNKIATLAAGDPVVAEYEIGDFRRKYRTIEELRQFYQLTYTLESLDSSEPLQSRVSYGRPRRFL